MRAIKRVKSSNLDTIGFILEDGNFYNCFFVRKNLEAIENLKLIQNNIFRADRELPTITYKEILKGNYHKLLKENPFKRDIQKYLTDWKKNNYRQVLQLEGARQIGKTTELLKFGYKNYESVIYVNLSNDNFSFISEVIRKGNYSFMMEQYCNMANLPKFENNRKTLLIIDEIQISSEVYNSLRDIRNELFCDIIVTGSYLGQTLKKDYFQPAGTITYLKMYPLSFLEFTRIYKQDKLLKEIDLFGGSNNKGYEKLYELYDIYRHIGGYPMIIKLYRKSNNYNICYSGLKNLLETFEKESRNYFEGTKETLIFKTVYTEALKQMCYEKQGSGTKLVEIITELVKDSLKMLVSRDEVSRAIQWLIYSGIIGECDLCLEGSFNKIVPARRLYFIDCGVANYIGLQTNIEKSVIDGFITENFVYSELLRIYNVPYVYKLVRRDLPSFSLYNNYELDFMILDNNANIYGLEVKTTDGAPKSLKVYLDKKLINKGILAKRTNGGKSGTFDTIPIFAVGARFPYNY